MSELRQLDVDSFNWEKRCFSVVGKGNKERLIPISYALELTLRHYLNHRQEWLGEAHTQVKALFVYRARKGFCLMPEAKIRAMLKEAASEAGIKKDSFGPHKLRHTFATLLYDSGVDLLKLQRLLGHAQLSTTQIYTHTTVQQLHESVEMHPVKLDQTE